MYSVCMVVFIPAFSMLSPVDVRLEVIVTQLKSEQSLVMSPDLKLVRVCADVQGLDKSRTRGLVATQLHLGELLEDRWCLACWGIPLWLTFSSSLCRSSPGLIGSKWAAVGQTHWLRGFPRELKNPLGRQPRVFLCKDKFGQTPFATSSKDPLPYKNKGTPINLLMFSSHSSKSCWLEFTKTLPSLIIIHRLGLCSFAPAAQLISIIPSDIWVEVEPLEEEWNYFWGGSVEFWFSRARNMENKI